MAYPQLCSLPPMQDLPELNDAFSACVALARERLTPTHLCKQCFSEPFEQKLLRASNTVITGGNPSAKDYAQIFFEHPNCSGGTETQKLFAPFAVRDLLTGCAPGEGKGFFYADVVETFVQAAFWFWPERLKSSLRELAACLFWEWFRDGYYPWVKPDYDIDDLLGPGDDILCLCTLCQLDPYDLIRNLMTCGTPQADDALCGPLNFSTKACTYVGIDTGRETKTYQSATEDIAKILAIREAIGYETYVTTEWVETAFFKYANSHPTLAKDLSEFGEDYTTRMTETWLRASQSNMPDWPNLPVV